jgi:hypothetical protein
MASTSFPFYVKTMYGDMIEMSFDPSNDSSLSTIYKELSQKLVCHPSQVYLFHLSEEEENKESSFIPSADEVVGVLIKEPNIIIFHTPAEKFGELYVHVRYEKYVFRITVFDTLYTGKFFYCPSIDKIYPYDSFYVHTRVSRGYLPGLRKKYEDNFKAFETFYEFVESIKDLPNYLYDSVTEMIVKRWTDIQMIDHRRTSSIPSK